MSTALQFWVPGVPQPGGSKRAFSNRKTGRAIVTEANPHSKDWRASVAMAAAEAANNHVLDGPLRVRFEFVFLRPQGHFGSGKNSGALKSSAPSHPIGRPDVTKCVRSSEDAMKGIVWRDDSQIVTQYGSKRYGAQAGCLITISPEEV